MGKQSQRKDAGGERELVEILRVAGYDAQRGGAMAFGEVPDLTASPAFLSNASARSASAWTKPWRK